MEVPGIRRVRSTHVPRRSRDLGAVRSGHRHDRRAAAGAEPGRRERGAAARRHRVHGEPPHACRVSDLSLNLTGASAAADLRDYAFYVIRPDLARVPGVGKVEVLASDTREIEVIVDPARLLRGGADGRRRRRALKRPISSARRPVSVQRVCSTSCSRRASGTPSPTSAPRRSSCTGRGHAARGDVARSCPARRIGRRSSPENGKPAAAISVSQQVGANMLDRPDGHRGRGWRSSTTSLPGPAARRRPTTSRSSCRRAIANVRDAIVVGGVLAVLVLLVFLRDWRLTLVAAVTLPLTVLATFFLMRVVGESINLMSMGGLAVAIGLVIDDAVVVVENITAARGRGRGEAARGATTELVAPVVELDAHDRRRVRSARAAVGRRRRVLPRAVADALGRGAGIARARAHAHPAARRRARRPARQRGAADAGAGGARRVYAALRRCPRLARRPAYRGGARCSRAAAARSFSPAWAPVSCRQADEGGFVIDYLTPAGHRPRGDRPPCCEMEAVLDRTPEVAAYSRRTGSELGLLPRSRTRATSWCAWSPRGRARLVDEIIERPAGASCTRWRPTCDIEFVQLLQDMIGDLEGNPTPIEVKVFGDDPACSPRVAEKRVERVRYGYAASWTWSACSGEPETTWHDRPVAAGRLGLTVESGGAARRRTGSGRLPPTCASPIAPCRCACGCPSRCAWIPRGWAATIRGRRRSAAVAGAAHVSESNGQ